LLKLGLNIVQEETPVPSLSHLHLSANQPSDVAELVSSWEEIIEREDGEEYIKGENDTFHLEKPSTWSRSSLSKAVASVLPNVSEDDAKADGNDDRIQDYDKITKRLIPHEDDLPSAKETPSFNHPAFFSHLAHYASSTRDCAGEWGHYLLYGAVVTSTNTLLEKNNRLLSHLPTGFTFTATTQVAGRGRGSNVWVSPPGAFIFSTVLRHPMSMTQSAPVVFIQYLAALAVVQGIHTYAPGYSSLDIKLKWPNDIYARAPSIGNPVPSTRKAPTPTNLEHGTPPAINPADYVKIGGILVNSSYAGSDYTLVAGIGINLANAGPTTSLNALAAQHRLPPFDMEKLLARILTRFEAIYTRFRRNGWDGEVEAAYLTDWLHAGQVVRLEASGGGSARIKGVTRDWGMLLAEEVDEGGRGTGKMWRLQSDSNSFDFFKGLVKRKV